jgi:transposase InsO family protein
MVVSVKLPPRSPNLNAYAERFVRTIKESCLDRLVLFGENPLQDGRSCIRNSFHYHAEPTYGFIAPVELLARRRHKLLLS